MQKTYNYTLYLNDGTTVRSDVSAASDDIARATLQALANSREGVQHVKLDELDDSAELDWDKNLNLWQMRLF